MFKRLKILESQVELLDSELQCLKNLVEIRTDNNTKNRRETDRLLEGILAHLQLRVSDNELVSTKKKGK